MELIINDGKLEGDLMDADFMEKLLTSLATVNWRAVYSADVSLGVPIGLKSSTRTYFSWASSPVAWSRPIFQSL